MQDRFKSEYIDKFPVAMAYVPWQHLTNVFETSRKHLKQERFSLSLKNLSREGDA